MSYNPAVPAIVQPEAPPAVLDPSGKYRVSYQGAFAVIEVAVSVGDGLKTESGAMLTMSNNLEMDAKMDGGVGSALARKVFTNESFFITHFSVTPGKGNRGDVILAPPLPGEIILLHLDGQTTWCLKAGCFLAADETVTTSTKMLKLSKGILGGSGLFVMEARGPGRLVANSYGSIMRFDLQPGEIRVIDTGYVVAWTSFTHYELTKACKSIANSLFSGEGFVYQYTGPGTVYVQTRSIKALAKGLIPFLPAARS